MKKVKDRITAKPQVVQAGEIYETDKRFYIATESTAANESGVFFSISKANGSISRRTCDFRKFGARLTTDKYVYKMHDSYAFETVTLRKCEDQEAAAFEIKLLGATRNSSQ